MVSRTPDSLAEEDLYQVLQSRGERLSQDSKKVGGVRRFIGGWKVITTFSGGAECCHKRDCLQQCYNSRCLKIFPFKTFFKTSFFMSWLFLFFCRFKILSKSKHERSTVGENICQIGILSASNIGSHVSLFAEKPVKSDTIKQGTVNSGTSSKSDNFLFLRLQFSRKIMLTMDWEIIEFDSNELSLNVKKETKFLKAS